MKKKLITAIISMMTILFIFPTTPVIASTNTATYSLEFLDNGTLTLNAQGVPLETLLEEIQENTRLEYQVHKKHLEQPISVSFQSLPLSQAIKRILHGVSYACIFNSKGSVEKIISFSNADKINESPFHKTVQLRRFPYREGVQIAPSHEMEDIKDTMKMMSPSEVPKTIEEIMKYGPAPEMDETGENMEITAPPKVVDHMVESMGNIP